MPKDLINNNHYFFDWITVTVLQIFCYDSEFFKKTEIYEKNR